MISAVPGAQIVAEAGSAEEVLEAVAREKPHVAVLDLEMPGVRGMELVRTLRKRYPSLGLLVFSMHREEEVALECLKAGASGFLHKDAPESELVHAVRTVSLGRRYLSPALMEALVEEAPLPVQDPPHVTLSERELDVLLRLANGARIADIAVELGISAKTVHTYRTRILAKLDAKTNVDLVLYAVQHRLLGWSPREVTRARERGGSA